MTKYNKGLYFICNLCSKRMHVVNKRYIDQCGKVMCNYCIYKNVYVYGRTKCPFCRQDLLDKIKDINIDILNKYLHKFYSEIFIDSNSDDIFNSIADNLIIYYQNKIPNVKNYCVTLSDLFKICKPFLLSISKNGNMLITIDKYIDSFYGDNFRQFIKLYNIKSIGVIQDKTNDTMQIQYKINSLGRLKRFKPDTIFESCEDDEDYKQDVYNRINDKHYEDKDKLCDQIEEFGKFIISLDIPHCIKDLNIYNELNKLHIKEDNEDTDNDISNIDSNLYMDNDDIIIHENDYISNVDDIDENAKIIFNSKAVDILSKFKDQVKIIMDDRNISHISIAELKKYISKDKEMIMKIIIDIVKLTDKQCKQLLKQILELVTEGFEDDNTFNYIFRGGFLNMIDLCDDNTKHIYKTIIQSFNNSYNKFKYILN